MIDKSVKKYPFETLSSAFPFFLYPTGRGTGTGAGAADSTRSPPPPGHQGGSLQTQPAERGAGEGCAANSRHSARE
jgi:hypothetical protein